ncbi:YqiA/YcfP family alpha/beta fold hydrolase [Massilia glaciei]|uniref:Esterase n=1 Tax=Massilia glaciei TaxID=1524097 RepID=A0A2U2I6A4_9BURK|nr:YqiA/YcfP family alpha/beta fold hydrolase [Massilia glaciei]PWF55280.1 esterase [Massilia glaciei]
MILYLHGFRSSPLSAKARLTARAMAARGLEAELVCPQLPASPKAAMALALDLVAGADPARLAVVGSSLGGYYAAWLAERLGCRAVLLNPAVTPLRDLDAHVGVGTAFHSDAPFEFKREYIDELGELAVSAITRPERYFLIAATGDEVLDHRDMLLHYAGARRHVVDGGDHALSNYPELVDEVLAFCLPDARR